MDTSESIDDVVFKARTLRLIIGALAFAFPAMVCALAGKITPSISASYYEPETRDVFVGFLFIIGALWIAYKGHPQGKGWTKEEDILSWILSLRWIKIYQEDLISTVGGLAAILTALFPTACKGCAMDTDAIIHTTGAFIMFGSVVYFCMIAFLRSLNRKILESDDYKEDQEFVRQLSGQKPVIPGRSQTVVRRLLGFLCLPFPDASAFLRIADEVSRNYDVMKEAGISLPTKPRYLWNVYEKKIARGYVYVWCGLVIALTLLSFLVMLIAFPTLVDGTNTTFLIETIALVFFGFAWMTASKLEYLAQIQRWLASREQKTPQLAQPDTA